MNNSSAFSDKYTFQDRIRFINSESNLSLNSKNYDSMIICKLSKTTVTSLKQSANGKNSHEVHLAITGDKRGIFPFIYNSEYLDGANNLDSKTRQLLKSFYVLTVPFLFYGNNAEYMYNNYLSYKDGNQYKQRYVKHLSLYGNYTARTNVSIKSSFRKNEDPQLEVGTGNNVSSKAFGELRSLAQIDDYLIILKYHSELKYSAVFLKGNNNNKWNSHINKLILNKAILQSKSSNQTTVPVNKYQSLTNTNNILNKKIPGYNIIYYGAPGTGKSHKISSIVSDDNKPNVFRTTFYPDYDYSNFVGQIIPSVNYGGTDQANDTQIHYNFNPGIFTQALDYALQNPNQLTFLIIEELSRANASAVFGDLFQLLDRTNGVSDYSVINHPIAKYLIYHGVSKKYVPDDKIRIPSNLIIMATLNTSDQNVTPMDSAFKRRFSWHYISSHPSTNLDKVSIKNANTKISIDNKTKIPWFIFYQYINWYIANILYPHENSEDKQIGLFFIKFTGKPEDQIRNNLLQYLWNDVSSAYISPSKRIFNSRSFDEAYKNYGNSQVFSQSFLRGLATYKNLFTSNDINKCIKTDNTTFPNNNRCRRVIDAVKGSIHNDEQ